MKGICLPFFKEKQWQERHNGTRSTSKIEEAYFPKYRVRQKNLTIFKLK
jgi:hypothetical protein